MSYIEPRLDLEATAGFLTERNRWIETAKETKHSYTKSDYNGSSPAPA